jgi:hypothetical protein
VTAPYYGVGYYPIPKVVQDRVVGAYDVDWLRDNVTDVWEGFFHIHGAPSVVSMTTPPWLLMGHHEEPVVARLVVNVEFGLIAGTTPTVTATLMNTAQRGVERFAPGEYFVSVPALAARSFGPVMPAVASNALTRIARAVHVTSPSTGLVVSTFELSGGDFVRVDYSFSLPIWEVP